MPKMSDEKEIIIHLRNNPHFRWGHSQTLECGQLHLRGLDVLGYFNSGHDDGLVTPVGPRADVLFDLLCDALISTGSKIVHCVPHLELAELRGPCEKMGDVGGGKGGSSGVTAGGGEVVHKVEDEDGGVGWVRGGEGDAVKEEIDTRAQGRHGMTRKRAASKRGGKQSMRAGGGGDGHSENVMELDG